MYLHFFIKSLIFLHVFPQKLQVAIRLEFKFMQPNALFSWLFYRIIEFAACFPWKVASGNPAAIQVYRWLCSQMHLFHDFFHFFLLKPSKMTCKLYVLLSRFPIYPGFGSHDMVFVGLFLLHKLAQETLPPLGHGERGQGTGGKAGWLGWAGWLG